MKIYSDGKLHLRFGTKTEYPFWGMLAITGLIGLSIFTSDILSMAAFVLCMYRLVKYDAKVFAADYCVLMPFTQIFKAPGGVSYFVYLGLIGAIWYFFKGKVKANGGFIVTFIILVYFIARMQMSISNFVLCFGQLFLVYVLVSKQDSDSAETAAKAFCTSLILSSVFALLIRNTPQLIAARGRESSAMWGIAVKRFQGLYNDPNYFMVTLMIGIAILAKLRDSGKIDDKKFIASTLFLSVLGFLTFSKTFVLAFAIFGIAYIFWQFRNRNYGRGLLVIGGSVGAVAAMLTMNFDLFSIIIARFTSSGDLNDFTTGRTGIYKQYLEEITESPFTILFGHGFAAKGLEMDPHNIYIEILYYVGVIGLILMIWFCFEMIGTAKRRTNLTKKQNFFSKYIVLLMFAILYFTLQGLFAIVAYTELLLAFLSIMISHKEKDAIKE